MRKSQQARSLLALVALACFAAVGGALVSQYRFDMLPCPWCTLQRLEFLVLGVLALLGAVLPGAALRRGLAGLAVLVALAGAASAAASPSCDLTLADRIMTRLGLYELSPEVFAPQASCADAAVNLLGIPYAFWSLALFALCGLVAVQVLRRPS